MSRWIYLPMMAGLVVMTVVMFGIGYSTGGSVGFQGSVAGMILGGTCVVLMITAVPMGFVLHRKQIQDSVDPETGDPTPAAVQTATILRLAMIEGPSLFGAICILLVHPAMVIVPALGLGLMILTYPRQNVRGGYGRNPYDPGQ